MNNVKKRIKEDKESVQMELATEIAQQFINSGDEMDLAMHLLHVGSITQMSDADLLLEYLENCIIVKND